jgi:integrase
MQDGENPTPVASKRIPWNKGKLTGAKSPLRPKHVWSIRTKLQMADRKRDLALFNLAIDSKLRGCDVIAFKVEDIAPHGYAIDRATVRQKKTGQPVRFEVTEQTRQAVDDYLRVANRKRGDLLLPRGVNLIGASRSGNMRVWSATGYAASVSIRACSVRIHCVGPRPR